MPPSVLKGNLMNKIQNFQLLSKPTGSVCNIDCEYCFYLEKEHLYPERKQNWKMDLSTLRNYVVKNIQSQPADTIDFIWQGGEPLLAGIDFFKKAVELQNEFKGKKVINNFFQTNGILINDEWCQFFKENNFLVGISIDGNAIHHNTFRKTRAGKNTYEKVVDAINKMKKFGVEFNTMTVVSSSNVDEPLVVYETLKKLGSNYMHFIPLVERIANKPTEDGLYLIKPDFDGEANVAPWSVPKEQYGKFLNTIFDQWYRYDIGQVFVMNFEQTINQMVGGKSICVFEKECGANLALESNGDIYSCDHYVFPEDKIGNINTDSLPKVANSERQIKFSDKKRNLIDKECLSCPVLDVCNGGCPKHRFLKSHNGMMNKNYLCQSYKDYFTHVVPHMKNIINEIFK